MTAVDGIDAVIVGHNVPILQQGRTVRNSVASYGGEQGHYVAVTTLTIDAHGRSGSGEAATYMLGPEIADKGTTLARVKAFEDAFNTKLGKLEQKHQLDAAAPVGDPASAPHFVGAEMCGRCHATEYAQWKTTAHAGAWHTMQREHKTATPECIRCHVLGYQQAGGFKAEADSTRLANVQCESCHGMGTEHDAMAANTPKLTQEVCRKCHTDESSPAFQFAVYEPHILHHVPAVLPPLPPRPTTHVSMK